MAVDIELLKSGNRRALAKAITLVESSVEQHRQEAQSVLEQVSPETGNSIRIGISGLPGAGKSTFIEAFGQHLIGLGKKVAVLAVDPSSPIHGGSILGDKTRMENLSREEAAFVRPSPAGGNLGGVAQKTRESILLCEAAGYDVILVETVGTGQSEFEVAGMVDCFLLLTIPNAGDELQGMKKGVLELVDALLINKADGDAIAQAEKSQRDYQNAFQLMPHSGFWTPQVRTCSALEKKNLEEVWDLILEYQNRAVENQAFAKKRAEQNIDWMQQLTWEMLENKLTGSDQIREIMPRLKEEVRAGRITPYVAAQRIVNTLGMSQK